MRQSSDTSQGSRRRIRRRHTRQFRRADGGRRLCPGGIAWALRSIWRSSTASSPACAAALDAAVTSTARDLTTGKIEPKDAKARFENIPLRKCRCRLRPRSARARFPRRRPDGKDGQGKRPRRCRPVLSAVRGARQGASRSKSAALYSDKTIEVAMMLDITGSMGGQKIKDLKTAANNALDAFLEGPGSEEAARARRDRALCGRRQHRQPRQQRLCRDQVHGFGTACGRRSAWPRRARRQGSTAARPSARAASNSPTPARPRPWSTATIGWNSVPVRR